MKLTALVEHILVKQQGRLSEVIAEELDITRVGCLGLAKSLLSECADFLPQARPASWLASSPARAACFHA